MDKSPDAFRSIGEVSRLVGVAPHVLRYWETQFSQLSPVKRGDGRRYYRPDDVRLAAGLCQIMREEGMSIRGAKRMIAADRGVKLRGIGAGRLGESLGENLASRPAPSPEAAPARGAGQPPRPASAPGNGAQGADHPAQPMGAGRPALLVRLCASAGQLRRLETTGVTLPRDAVSLRQTIRATI